MRTGRPFLPLVAFVAATFSTALPGQETTATTSKSRVDIVQTVGCAERRGGDPDTWWLTRVPEPTVPRSGVFSVTQIEEAGEIELGAGELQLIGVADFLDAESLLEWGERAEFTTPEQANATGELREGRKVLVKGPLIETDTVQRINLLAVVGLAETCE